ncbi:MAG: lipopolysaccharide heptosyltransferase family protein [Alphaproteobacteria bacterium]|jgi:ADP-heptose:LPS heptosyltransferase|nr:lipopolysaccharide heptosyltransferase family protein [Alphaproteobacteria bacterium]
MTDRIKSTDPQSLNPGREARAVLVIRLAERGPFILALGAVEALRRVHPHARIDCLTRPAYREFAQACPYFDDVIAGGVPGDGKARKALAGDLAARRYDIIYDFETSETTARLYKRMRRQRGRVAPWSGTAPDCALPHDMANRERQPTIERLSDQLRQAGALPALAGAPSSAPALPDLGWVAPVLGDPPRLRPAYFSLATSFMLYAPVQSEADRALRWPAERHVEIARRIAAAGVQPVVIGGHAESPVGHEIARAVPSAKNLIGRTDLFQVSALARQALFVLGSALEPVHMAALSGTPTVLVLSQSQNDPDRDRPQGALSIVIHGETLRKISTDDIWQAIIALDILPAPRPRA